MKQIIILIAFVCSLQHVFGQGKKQVDYNQLANTSTTVAKPSKEGNRVKKPSSFDSLAQQPHHQHNPADTISFDRLPAGKTRPVKAVNYDQLAH